MIAAHLGYSQPGFPLLDRPNDMVLGQRFFHIRLLLQSCSDPRKVDLLELEFSATFPWLGKERNRNEGIENKLWADA